MRCASKACSAPRRDRADGNGRAACANERRGPGVHRACSRRSSRSSAAPPGRVARPFARPRWRAGSGSGRRSCSSTTASRRRPEPRSPHAGAISDIARTPRPRSTRGTRSTCSRSVLRPRSSSPRTETPRARSAARSSVSRSRAGSTGRRRSLPCARRRVFARRRPMAWRSRAREWSARRASRRGSRDARWIRRFEPRSRRSPVTSGVACSARSRSSAGARRTSPPTPSSRRSARARRSPRTTRAGGWERWGIAGEVLLAHAHELGRRRVADALRSSSPSQGGDAEGRAA